MSDCVCVNVVLENAHNGSTLSSLIEDMEEFKAVLPRSGHRLLLKKLAKYAIRSETFNMDDVSLLQVIHCKFRPVR